jgi:threonine-phosphate decarboxylase
MRKVAGSVANDRLFRHGGNAPTDRSRPLLDFSANLNPLGPPSSVLEALRRELPAVARYPDPHCRLLAGQLAAGHGVGPDQVIVGNGSNDLIYALARAFRPRRVAIVEPTYTEYLRASLLGGAAVDHWLPEDVNFQPQPFDPGPASLVWLANPNNPTGRLWAPGRLVPWIEAHSRVRFVVDEAFLPFLGDEEAHTLIPAVGRLPNLVVLRSLTKLYTLPGLRLGYAVVAQGQDRELRQQLSPWSVNALAQIAGVAALADEGFLASTRAWLRSEGGAFFEQLQCIPGDVEVIPSRANFLLLRLRRGRITARSLRGLLAERGIAIRDASNFIGLDDHSFRVAVRTAEDNCRLVDELRSLPGGA